MMEQTDLHVDCNSSASWLLSLRCWLLWLSAICSIFVAEDLFCVKLAYSLSSFLLTMWSMGRLSCWFHWMCASLRNTHILESLSSLLSWRLLYSLRVMPTSMGIGASIMSSSWLWSRGTRARHHFKGYSKEFKASIADDTLHYLPTNTIEVSNNTADNNRSTYSNGNTLNKERQNQRQST
jgi:hypothetical protein